MAYVIREHTSSGSSGGPSSNRLAILSGPHLAALHGPYSQLSRDRARAAAAWRRTSSWATRACLARSHTRRPPRRARAWYVKHRRASSRPRRSSARASAGSGARHARCHAPLVPASLADLAAAECTCQTARAGTPCWHSVRHVVGLSSFIFAAAAKAAPTRWARTA